MLALYRSVATGVLMEMISEDDTAVTVVGVFEPFYYRVSKPAFEKYMRVEPAMTRDGVIQW